MGSLDTAALLALAERLEEAVTVLDEPFHREAVAAVAAEAAATLRALATPQETPQVAVLDMAVQKLRRGIMLSKPSADNGNYAIAGSLTIDEAEALLRALAPPKPPSVGCYCEYGSEGHDRDCPEYVAASQTRATP